MRTKRTVMAAVAATAMMAGLSSPAFGAQAAGPERLTFILRFPQANALSQTGQVVASGPVSGVGTLTTGGGGETFPVTIVLPQGNLNLVVTSGPTNDSFNQAACVATFTGTDTVQVTGGTGAFAGARGGGSDSSQGTVVLPRNPDGSCNTDGEPVAGVTIIRATINLS